MQKYIPQQQQQQQQQQQLVGVLLDLTAIAAGKNHIRYALPYKFGFFPPTHSSDMPVGRLRSLLRL